MLPAAASCCQLALTYLAAVSPLILPFLVSSTPIWLSMISLAVKGPFLGCWLLASLALGSPDYSDNYSSSLGGAQPGTLSSSVADACKAESTKTVFVTLSSAGKQSSTASSINGANVETTTIIVSPVQSHAKSDSTVDAVTTDSAPAYEPATKTSSHSKAGDPASGLSSVEDTSTISRTILATHTITLTVASGKGSTSTESGVPSDVKGTGVASAVTETPSNIATCITHTVIGPDGHPTVVESIIITEPAKTSVSAVLGTAIPANSASATAPGIPVPSYSGSITSGLPVHTSFTAIGPDGSSTIIDTTWIIPVPPTSVMSGLNPLPSGVISSGRIVSGLSSNAASQTTAESPMTSVMGTPTCTTVTVVGPDMRPTVTELTIIAPTGASAATASTLTRPPFVAPASITNLASQPPITSNSVVTTITWKVIGADGTVSPIIQTITAPSGSVISGIPATLPAPVTANLPQPAATGSSGSVPLLTPYGTVRATGEISSSVGSIVSGLGSMPTIVPAPTGLGVSSVISEEPPAYSVDSGLPPPMNTIGTSSAQHGTSSLDSDWISSILYGSLPAPTPPSTPLPETPVPGTPFPGTPEPIPASTVGPIPVPTPESSLEPIPVPTAEPTPFPTPEPTPEPMPTPVTPATPEAVTTLVTSTWTNVIPEQTTTYVIKFPLTTLATITVPRGPPLRKRLLRRQSSVETLFPFSNSSSTPSPFTENTSLISSLSSQLVTPSTTPPPPTNTIPTSTIPTSTIPTTPANTPVGEPSSTVCASGGDRVGNSTVTFDNLLPGPLLNPASDLWFSEGFLVAPPSSPPSTAYFSSSGHQLVEFLPPALVPDAPFDGAGDTAEIGIGPNEISPCFRFNFYGASLGCAAEGVEQWCEFEFSAYTYNETLGSETSLSWSETKRVPACPNFPQGPCPLIPVQLDGYNNVTSILVTVRVGLELRAWWGDDFQIGWTDNTCEAASCRTSAVSRRAKREAFSRASRRGVWQWTPTGVKKIDDDYVWSSFE
ncbi:hypothetical protein A9K55_005149 [Cordyceps militaris]|uniref:DUF7371 domain-containing protein n=1 Tax=Cordyceps militaris TaxID=73501 RepID=A0A2H4SNQ6_CORMI|nr:hypothetical protein A9K55_005149 [Cordyceps militaris]